MVPFMVRGKRQRARRVTPTGPAGPHAHAGKLSIRNMAVSEKIPPPPGILPCCPRRVPVAPSGSLWPPPGSLARDRQAGGTCHHLNVRGRRNGATRRGGFQMNAYTEVGSGSAATSPRTAAQEPADRTAALYRRPARRRGTRRELAAAKVRGEKWPMLTAYDALTARVFDDAGIPVLLVGDSAAMVVYGHDTTIPVTVDDLIPLTAAVVRGTSRALVVADLPFVSYQASPEAALQVATRFLKEAGAHAVK